jgi:hypothetical protein
MPLDLAGSAAGSVVASFDSAALAIVTLDAPP